jgi:hypothetical protein
MLSSWSMSRSCRLERGRRVRKRVRRLEVCYPIRLVVRTSSAKISRSSVALRTSSDPVEMILPNGSLLIPRTGDGQCAPPHRRDVRVIPISRRQPRPLGAERGVPIRRARVGSRIGVELFDLVQDGIVGDQQGLEVLPELGGVLDGTGDEPCPFVRVESGKDGDPFELSLCPGDGWGLIHVGVIDYGLEGPSHRGTVLCRQSRTGVMHASAQVLSFETYYLSCSPGIDDRPQISRSQTFPSRVPAFVTSCHVEKLLRLLFIQRVSVIGPGASSGSPRIHDYFIERTFIFGPGVL